MNEELAKSIYDSNGGSAMFGDYQAYLTALNSNPKYVSHIYNKYGSQKFGSQSEFEGNLKKKEPTQAESGSGSSQTQQSSGSQPSQAKDFFEHINEIASGPKKTTSPQVEEDQSSIIRSTPQTKEQIAESVAYAKSQQAKEPAKPKPSGPLNAPNASKPGSKTFTSETQLTDYMAQLSKDPSTKAQEELKMITDDYMGIVSDIKSNGAWSYESKTAEPGVTLTGKVAQPAKPIFQTAQYKLDQINSGKLDPKTVDPNGKWEERNEYDAGSTYFDAAKGGTVTTQPGMKTKKVWVPSGEFAKKVEEEGKDYLENKTAEMKVQTNIVERASNQKNWDTYRAVSQVDVTTPERELAELEEQKKNGQIDEQYYTTKKQELENRKKYSYKNLEATYLSVLEKTDPDKHKEYSERYWEVMNALNKKGFETWEDANNFLIKNGKQKTIIEGDEDLEDLIGIDQSDTEFLRKIRAEAIGSSYAPLDRTIEHASDRQVRQYMTDIQPIINDVKQFSTDVETLINSFKSGAITQEEYNSKVDQLKLKEQELTTRAQQVQKETGVTDFDLNRYSKEGEVQQNLAINNSNFSPIYEFEKQKERNIEDRQRWVTENPVLGGLVYGTKDAWRTFTDMIILETAKSIKPISEVLEVGDGYGWSDRLYYGAETAQNNRDYLYGYSGMDIDGDGKADDLPEFAKLTQIFGQGIGSVAAFAIPGAAAGKAFSGAGKLATIGRFGVNTTGAFLMMEGQAYQEALRSGLSQDDAAEAATLIASLQAVAEQAISDVGYFNNVSTRAGLIASYKAGIRGNALLRQGLSRIDEIVKNTATGGAKEFGEEYFQALSADLGKQVSNELYDRVTTFNMDGTQPATYKTNPYQNLYQAKNLIDNGVAGFITGGGLRFFGGLRPMSQMQMQNLSYMGKNANEILRIIEQTQSNGINPGDASFDEIEKQLSGMSETWNALQSMPGFMDLTTANQDAVMALTYRKNQIQENAKKLGLTTDAVKTTLSQYDQDINDYLTGKKDYGATKPVMYNDDNLMAMGVRNVAVNPDGTYKIEPREDLNLNAAEVAKKAEEYIKTSLKDTAFADSFYHPKTDRDALSKQEASEVSVQPEAGVSQEVAQGKPTTEPQVTTEEGKKEKIGTSATPAYGAIAADYLFTGGPDVILSTDYLIQGIGGAFTRAGAEIEQIRNKYIASVGDLGNLKSSIGTENYNNMMAEIREAINRNYNNSSEAQQIFDEVLKYSTGFPVKLGNQVSSRLDKLNEQATTTETKPQEVGPSVQGQETTQEISKEKVDVGEIASSFKEDYNSGKINRGDFGGSRNLGVYDYKDKIVKVVKNKRGLSPDQVSLMNERLGDMDNVFITTNSIDLGNGKTALVMNKANGKDASKLTQDEIDVIPQEHWDKFENDIRELSKRGVQVDLTKRDNFFYDQNSGFNFIDIGGVSADGKSTNKFFEEDGSEYYYPFEKYRLSPNKFEGGKSMFENISISNTKTAKESKKNQEDLLKNRNVDFFPDQTGFAQSTGESESILENEIKKARYVEKNEKKAKELEAELEKRKSKISSYTEVNGIGVAEYTNPTSGVVDVIMSGTSDNNYVGYIRIYKNGKPTNRWTSKMSNESDNKEAFKTMISQVQSKLPENHEYTESTNISLEGLDFYSQQLNYGYEIATDEKGNPLTTTIALNQASKEGLKKAKTQEEKEDLYTEMNVESREEFDKIKEKVSSILPSAKVSWNEKNNTVRIQLPVLRKTSKATTETANATEVTPKPTAQVKPTAGAIEVKPKVFDTARKNELLAKFKNDSGKRALISSIDRAATAIRQAYGNVPIYVHETTADMESATAITGGESMSRAGAGTFQYDDKGNIIAVHVNLAKAGLDTAPHEFTHLILMDTFGDNPKLFNEFKDRISKVLSTSRVAELEAFANQYKDTEVRAEEFIAQLAGLMTANQEKLTPTTTQKIINLINEFISRITKGKLIPFKSNAKTKDLMDFFNTVSSAMATGQRGEAIKAAAQKAGSKFETAKKPTQEAGARDKSREAIIGQVGVETAADDIAMQDLDVAKQMEAANRAAQDIKSATGWEVGADGEWRYEYPDVELNEDIEDDFDIMFYLQENARREGVRVRPNEMYPPAPLNKILDFGKLEKAYPYIDEIAFAVNPNLGKATAVFRPDRNLIEFGPNAIKNDGVEGLTRTLIHEVQHYIQEREGFDFGSNLTEEADKFSKSQDVYKIPGLSLNGAVNVGEAVKNGTKEILDMMDNGITVTDIIEGNYDKTKYSGNPEAIIKHVADSDDAVRLDELAKTDLDAVKIRLENGIQRNAIDDVAYEQYRSIAGEVEARNAEERSRIPYAERLYGKTLESTEDVARRNQVLESAKKAVSAMDVISKKRGVSKAAEIKAQREILGENYDKAKQISDNFEDIAEKLGITKIC